MICLVLVLDVILSLRVKIRWCICRSLIVFSDVSVLFITGRWLMKIRWCIRRSLILFSDVSVSFDMGKGMVKIRWCIRRSLILFSKEAAK